MENTASLDSRPVKVMRWIARIIGLLLILLTLYFMIGEGLTEHRPNAQPTPIINILVGVLMLGGLGLAWKWELIGALTSLVGFIGVAIVNPDALTRPGMFLFAIPSILFLLCWLLRKSHQPIETSRPN